MFLLRSNELLKPLYILSGRGVLYIRLVCLIPFGRHIHGKWVVMKYDLSPRNSPILLDLEIQPSTLTQNTLLTAIMGHWFRSQHTWRNQVKIFTDMETHCLFLIFLTPFRSHYSLDSSNVLYFLWNQAKQHCCDVTLLSAQESRTLVNAENLWGTGLWWTYLYCVSSKVSVCLLPCFCFCALVSSFFIWREKKKKSSKNNQKSVWTFFGILELVKIHNNYFHLIHSNCSLALHHEKSKILPLGREWA